MAYATLAQVKEFLGIVDSSKDALLVLLIGQASRMVDDYCQRTFEEPVVEEREFRTESTGFNLFVPDIISASSLKIEGALVDPSGYRLFPLDAPSKKQPFRWIRFTAGAFFQKGQLVGINGKWGYQDTVPDPIVLATVLLAGKLFRERGQSDGRIESESIGDYRVSYSREENTEAEAPENILNSYRRRDLESF